MSSILHPDKSRVFREAQQGSERQWQDVPFGFVLLKDLTAEERSDEKLICSCVGGALLKEEYLRIIREAGFIIRIIDEDKDISKRHNFGHPLASLKLELRKK